MLRTLRLLPFLALATATQAQTTYSYTIPTTFQGVNSYVQFTFPATPPTTGDATLTLQWLACHQPGFGGSSITVQINTSTGWQTIRNNPNNLLECIYVTETITIPAALLADAIATGGGSVMCRVDCDDSCQAGVGCSFYNDPVVSGITLNYTAHAADFTSDAITLCPGGTVHFMDASLNTPSSYMWIMPGAVPSTSTSQNPTVQYQLAGTYDVTLVVVTADGTDTLEREGYITVHLPPPANAGVDEGLCAGTTTQLQAGGGVSYQWFPATGLSDPDIAAPVASPEETTSYTVLVTDANGCEASDFMVLTVHPQPTIDASAGNNGLCLGDTVFVVATGAQLYQWSPNLFINTTSGAQVQVWPTSTFTWDIHGTDAFGCEGDGTLTITVHPLPAAPVVTNNGAQVSSTPAAAYQWYVDGDAIAGATAQSWTPVVNGNYSVEITDADGCSAMGLPVFFGTVGVADVASRSLRIFPQPVHDQLVIEGAATGSSAKVFDVNGRVVWQGMLQAGPRTTIDVSALAHGSYTLELITPDGMQRLPLIKQ